MKKANWSIDLKSLIFGFLPAVSPGFLFSGFWQSRAATGTTIAADNDNICIFVDGSVRYIDKNKCRQGAGCTFNTQ